MAEASDTFGILHQNLIDAGCGEELIAHCMELARQDDWQGMLALLSGKKGELLKSVHNQQNRIDCLDFLVYKINKEKL